MKIIIAIAIFALLVGPALAETNDVDLLSDAVSKGDLPQITALRERGVNINTPNYLGWTPLYRAMINGNTATIHKLFEAGVVANAKNKDGETPLFVVPEGRVDLAELLLSKGADVDAVDQSGWTPLLSAIYSGGGKEQLALWLLAHGANVNAKNKQDITALHLAVKSGSKTLTEAVLAQGANINAKGNTKANEKWTPLHVAVEEGRVEIVDILLAKGADINAQTENGLTPLMLALYRTKPDIAELLIAKGADVSARSIKDGTTALNVAAAYGTLSIVERLLSKGADINAESESGGSPLDNAQFHDHDDIAALLIAKGAIVERYRCTTNYSNGASKSSIRHGPCLSPSDQRELLPPSPAQPKTNSVNSPPKNTGSPVEPTQARELIRCTSPDGKSSTLQRGKCASADNIQSSVTPVQPVLERSAANTKIIKCTSPDGKRVSIQGGNCASPEDIQQLLPNR